MKQVESEQSSAHILVVDDEREIAESVSDYLSRQEGYFVSMASDGQQAMSILENAHETPAGVVDLILLDMRMPMMSGRDVLKWIREHSNEDLSYTRVVMLTAASGNKDKVEALSAGADDYITKPYYPRELLARVKTILRTRQLEKKLQSQGEQLKALNTNTTKIVSTLNVREVMNAAVSGSISMLDAEAAIVYMYESGSKSLRCHTDSNKSLSNCAAIPVGEGLIGRAYEAGRSLLNNSPQEDPHFTVNLDAPKNVFLNSIIGEPLIVSNRQIGMFVVLNKRENGFNEVDADLFASLATSLSGAMQNSLSHQNIRTKKQQLEESSNTLQAVIDGIQQPIYTIDEAWNLVSVNKTQVNLIDATSNELLGRPCYEAIFGLDSPCDHCAVAELMNKQEHHAQNWVVKQTGEDNLLEEHDVAAYPLPTADKKGMATAVIVWQDRTEERRLEANLMQAGKLAAIGQLAAGVAHEINNPLTAINANAEMLRMEIDKKDDKYEAVELIHLAGIRAEKVVRGLLDFARKENYVFEPMDLHRNIQQALDLVSYQLKLIDINVKFEDMLPPVNASGEHLKSVWLNLMVNARDAFSEGQKDATLDIMTRIAPSGDHVQVLVRDNGKGMSEAEMSHIFEPFYTTKDPGKGTGLGLATCHSIIEQHGGEINVISEKGVGTTFVIRLPLERVAEETADMAEMMA